MINISVFHLKLFLQEVNDCSGAVYLVTPDGRKENLNKNYYAQEVLRQQYRENKSYLRLALDIPCPSDYMKIVTFSIGNC